MTFDEVSSKVKQDLGGLVANQFGWSVVDHILDPPCLEAFEDPQGNEFLMLAIIREEHGYTIALDPVDQAYCLCTNETVVGSNTNLIPLLNSI